jgi:hypothetical protein
VAVAGVFESTRVSFGGTALIREEIGAALVLRGDTLLGRSFLIRRPPLLELPRIHSR